MDGQNQPSITSSVKILLIGNDLGMYTDAVLKSAGFFVKALTPSEIKDEIAQELYAYPLVILNHTLYPDEVESVRTKLRRYSPASKVLLILTDDCAPVDISLFDATLDGWCGPQRLLREVSRIAGSTKSA